MIAKQTGRENAHILVVEDSSTQAVNLEYLLADHGYTVSVTGNGREALNFLKNEKPDLIISDIIMPFVDGYELCRIIKEDSALNRIPVILLTALSDPGEVINGLQCGADNFITKPYKEPFLLSQVENVIANQQFRPSDVIERGIDIHFAGKTHCITSSRFQIVDLLFSTFENAIQKNRELDEVNKKLSVAHDELQKKNSELLQLTLELDNRVAERTMELERKSQEIKAISQQLWQATKLATMGELAASIAHELNNPLTTIHLRLENLLDQLPADDSKRHILEIIDREADRMVRLISNLLQFSRRSAHQRSTIDIRQEIENTIELFYYILKKRVITVQKEYATDIPNISADRQQLQQLFLNIFTNAGDAMEKGGLLSIRIYPLNEGKDVAIEIADTGIGIPGDILARLTEPFFTTKPEGKGTGLGLSICRRIVKENQGTMEITSAGPCKGTTVRIVLPIAMNSDSVHS